MRIRGKEDSEFFESLLREEASQGAVHHVSMRVYDMENEDSCRVLLREVPSFNVMHVHGAIVVSDALHSMPGKQK